MHGHVCPYVSAVEFYPDGIVKRVEFVQWGPAQPLPSVSEDGKAGTDAPVRWGNHPKFAVTFDDEGKMHSTLLDPGLD
jgi:hypothetical protein